MASPGWIAVLGAGTWGTALSMQLARVGHIVRLWVRDPAQAQLMAETRINRRYLPDYTLPERITPSSDLLEVAGGAERVLVVTPSPGFREVLDVLAPVLKPDTGLAWATKGFEPGTGRLFHELAQSCFGEAMPLAVVTGPSFAREVAAGLPTAVTVGATNPEFGRTWAGLLHGPSFRAYYTADIIGAELGGAVKNVLAIACGIADGMGFGANTRAALITRGMVEMMRLGEAMGADPRTLTGLAGMGDLVLTCTGDASRNRRLGVALGRGETVESALAHIGQVVEGIGTAEEVMRLAARHDVELPISEQVHGILFKGWSAKKGVQVLMQRELKAETA